jgi:hypothetical protein
VGFHQIINIKLYKVWLTKDSYRGDLSRYIDYRGVWSEVITTPPLVLWLESSIGEDYVVPINNFLLTLHLLGISL